MNFEPTPSPLWWTKNPRYLIYFLRELTGPVIALYALWFLGGAMADQTLAFTHGTSFRFMSGVGLFASIFHTLTWFWVTVKIAPVPLPRALQMLGFLGLIAVWLGASFFLLHFFYVR